MPEEARAIHEMAIVVNDMRVVLSRVDQKLTDLGLSLSDHETRLRALERTKWLMVGAAAAAGGAAGKLIGLL